MGNEQIMTEKDALDYLMKRSIERGFDPRSAIEIAELHKRTGSTAINGTSDTHDTIKPQIAEPANTTVY